MDERSGTTSLRRAWAELIETAWPAVSPADSAWQQRKKRAVRGGHTTLAALVACAVLGTALACYPDMSPWRLAGLILVGMVYWGWSVLGLRDAVRVLLCEQGDPPLALWPVQPSRRLRLYFVAQLFLAGLIYQLGNLSRPSPVLWLVLLPPVAHAVILLPRRGVACVALASLGILLVNIAQYSDHRLAPLGGVLFVFALLFTVVFTSMVVGSEQARAEVLRLAHELETANAQLRQYAVQVDELAATRERNRLAREIHDHLGHSLTVIHVQLEAARTLRHADPAAAWQALEKAQGLTQAGLGEIRRSVAALRASPLDRQPLPEALAELAEQGRGAGTAIEFEVLGTPRTLAQPAALTLYRAAQEGLTNARKHSQARSVRLTLDFQPTSSVLVRVRDDGRGSERADPIGNGFGLLGLRERTQLLGGALRLHTGPGQGFALELEVPG